MLVTQQKKLEKFDLLNMNISKVSIIIPCFNEKNTIEIITKKVLEFSKYKKEIIIVDDFDDVKVIQSRNECYVAQNRHKTIIKGTTDTECQCPAFVITQESFRTKPSIIFDFSGSVQMFFFQKYYENIGEWIVTLFVL